MEIPIGIPIVFFVIALCYSMVGFGGGSSYLAVLVLAGFSSQVIPPMALVCNLIVAGGGFWHFYRGGHFRWKIIVPFVICSIPLAYLGGQWAMSRTLFSCLLGGALLCVAVRMAINDNMFEETRDISDTVKWIVGLTCGGFLGFLSGLVGIGGGIFLSPLLLLLRWVTVKQAAACASFFIIVNSLAGLYGQLQKGAIEVSVLWPLALAVFLGGQIGSRFGSYRVPALALRRVLAVLILYVSVKLIGDVL